MKAAVLRAAKTPFEVEDVVVDKPGRREVLVRVAASGLCHSDYHFLNGDLPFAAPSVLGHESAGIVESVGDDVTTVRVGDHVVACATVFCGHCSPCVSGKTHLCAAKPQRLAHEGCRLKLKNGEPLSQGSRIGGFAEQMLVHENAVARMPPEMPLDRAALLGCGVLTGLGSVFNAARVTAGSRVAVIGCGGVGLNVIQGARLAGADQIIAVDLMAQKRELALKLGATHAIEGGADAVASVRELSRGGVDYSFEVIGLPQTMLQAVQMLAPAGLMTIVGAMRQDAVIPLPGIAMLMNEWRVQGSYLGSSPFVREIPRFADLYLKGRLNLDILIAERIDLADINRGFETLIGATQARSVIVFPDVLQRAAAA